MNELVKFYQSLMQEVVAMQSGDEDGNTQEQVFTRICQEMLAEAGETEDAHLAYDERDFGRKGQHKINGYAISENYENVDLFISLYSNSSEIQSIPKADIDTAAKRISNFFRKAVYNDYANEVAESSEIFEFAHTLATYQELKDNLIRVNAFVLTNGEYKGDIPASQSISGYTIFYRIIDINFLFKISEQSRVPIELDFNDLDGKSYEIPCLAANIDNPDYEAYVAIIPGACLATLYHNYGARLLEQNVRSFLQFTGKINKGIRKTINEEPHMFLAFNNGIAATADYIELDETGRNIKHIRNLQIVNGGQTTASIFNTAKKDKADISQIYVQVKLSVIKDSEQYADIVSRISRYANTQNKVNDADFSANNPALIEIEKFSRYVLSPITPENNMQTYWFFERARGQFKTLRSKEGFTKSRLATFDLKYPKKQVFTKVELAKYINAWQEVYSGKTMVIGPHIVVRGNEKNYDRFIKYNLPEIKDIDVAYFEDAVAKAILFKAADKRYGTKVSGNQIGELKQVVVPYTLSLLNIITNGKLDLYKIWKNQRISDSLSDFIYELMKQVNAFIIDKSPVSHYIEWAKKEDCWALVKEHTWSYNLDDIKADCIDEKNPPKRNHKTDTEDAEMTRRHQESIIRSIPFSLWKKIEEWGRETGILHSHLASTASDIAYKIKNDRKLLDTDISRGYSIYETVWQYNPELLEEADALAAQDQESATQHRLVSPINESTDITLELIQQMVDWDKRRRVLDDWKWKVMKDVVDGKKEFTDRMKYAFYLNLQALKKKGFPN
jgi:hypothetical protein